jgi:hypothetical protein
MVATITAISILVLVALVVVIPTTSGQSRHTKGCKYGGRDNQFFQFLSPSLSFPTHKPY